MNNLKVAYKLLVGFGTALVAMLIIAVIATVSLNSISGEVKAFYEGPFEVVRQVDELELMLQESAKNALYASLSTDKEEIQKRLDMGEANLDEMEVCLEELRADYGGDEADIDFLISEGQKVKEALDEYTELCHSGDTVRAFKTYKEKMAPNLNAMVDTVVKMQDFEEQKAHSIYEDVTKEAKQSEIEFIVISIVFIVGCVLLAIYIIRSMQTALKDIEESIIDISNGKLDTSIIYTGKDEFGEMADSMRLTVDRLSTFIRDAARVFSELAHGNLAADSQAEQVYVGEFAPLLASMRQMGADLSSTMNTINTASNQVAMGSEQVSGGAQALSQGATEQAASIEELSATIAHISEMINSNANAAAEANKQTEATGAGIAEANAKMSELVEAMNEISASSNETKNIIKTIEDIAFQTNILALNAAVEAARAGDAGKGFAVVADEVRNLAGKSAEAANNTTALIESTVEAIERGTALVHNAADKMDEITNAAKAVVEINHKIASDSHSAADAIVQVTTGVNQISSVVQTNSATAEESAAASEELSSQSRVLKERISTFRLRG